MEFLKTIACELEDIHRGRDYALWRSEAVGRVNATIMEMEPFARFVRCRIHSGDGASADVGMRFGEWAIDQLVAKQSPEAIVAAFESETSRNSSLYEEVSPVRGVALEADLELTEGVRLVLPSSSILDCNGYSHRFRWPEMDPVTGFLVQQFRVTPAFGPAPGGHSVDERAAHTLPDHAAREAVRTNVRLACLLATSGPVEMPFSAVLGDRASLFQVEGNTVERARAQHPISNWPIDLAVVREVFDALPEVEDLNVVMRSAERLGRARLATDPVDKALDLGMAAELVLMHDPGRSNAEITYKVSSRGAWLLGEDVDQRVVLFDRMKALYRARSKAAHGGELSHDLALGLGDSDALVTALLRKIIVRRGLPDWKQLTLGGG